MGTTVRNFRSAPTDGVVLSIMDDELNIGVASQMAEQSEISSQTGAARAAELRGEAARCRRLTSSAMDKRTIEALTALSNEYDAEAERLSRA